MNINKYTEKAREAVAAAIELARQSNNPQLEPEHLLVALVEQREGIVPELLRKMNVDPAIVARGARELLKKLPQAYGGAEPGLSPRLKLVTDQAQAEADRLKDEYVSTEHLFIVVADEGGRSSGAPWLKQHGVTRDAILQALTGVRGSQRVTNENPEGTYQALERYGRDLTELARKEKLDPVIGRDEEIRRVIQVLSRRPKHNPVLTGQPGVGKSAIGATTLDEYRKYIEKDAALERRFQPVMVGEPTVEDTISILRGLRERYELHHGVKFKDAALVAAAVLSNRYISDRFLPDKAIDLVDEAASKLRMEIDSMPAELDEIERRIMQLEIEREALRKEKDKASKERLIKLDKELADLKEERGRVASHWQQEKEAIQRSRKLKEEQEALRLEIERAQRAGDYTKASELQYGAVPQLDKRIKDEEARLAELQKNTRMLKEEVDEEDIAEVVSKWTHIPVSRLMEGEVQKLIHMEERLHLRIIGQDEAINAVANAIRRARAGLQDPNRPLGSFLFLGPTGVGKTELARALAEFLFDDEQAMIRIDMSEYQEKHTVSRMVGAPPGYVGYDEGGQLTEAVRRRPYAVLLFDEVEKAHADVFNVLLQLLDDGRLTDGHGRTVDFRNTVVIMTSNLGSHIFREYERPEKVRPLLMQELRSTLRPEFLNRIDEAVIFAPLGREEIARIVEIQLGHLQRRLAARRIELEVTDAARALLGREGYDPTFGARPLKRTIQRLVQDPLSLKLLQREISDGHTVPVDAEGEAIIFKRTAPAEVVS